VKTYIIFNIRLDLDYRTASTVWDAFKQVRSYPNGYGVKSIDQNGYIQHYDRNGRELDCLTNYSTVI